jgi:hypothetical protein
MSAMRWFLFFFAPAAARHSAPCDTVSRPNFDYNGGDLPNQPVSKTLTEPAE